MYKQSLYNLVITSLSDSDNVCIFNSKSGSIVKLEKAVWLDIINLQFESNLIKKYITDLLNQGILIDSKKNELQEILFEMRAKQYEKKGILSLVIAPTLHCNYKCTYCFENNQDATIIMDEKILNNIYNFIKNYLNRYPETKKLRVQWFGGEPLLAYEKVIIPLSDSLLQLSQCKNIEYESGMITNGYLLSQDVLKILVEKCRVTDYQITFDGRADNYYRLKRPPKNAYEIVKNNILSMSEYMEATHNKLNINIRINADKTNISDVYPFIEEIKQDHRYKDNFKFYLGRIRGMPESFSTKEFEWHENEFNNFLHKPPKIFNPKKIWCNQFTFNSFCVGPLGELYKCEHDFGYSERIIGDLVNGLHYNEYLENYITQPISEHCKGCKILPICLGGCPNNRFHFRDTHTCEFTYDNVIKHVEQYVQYKKLN